MKKIVEQVDNEGLESLLGERVILLCANYFYTGTLIGVNESCVMLDDAAIVYETGPWGTGKFKDEQKLGISPFYVQTDAIESYGATK